MFHHWFDQINAFLHSHPHWLSHLAFLFRFKLGLLAGLMLVFLYLIYKEQSKHRAEKSEPRRSQYRFLA